MHELSHRRRTYFVVCLTCLLFAGCIQDDPKNTSTGKLQMAQDGKPWMANVVCFKCGKKGHVANDCTENNNSDNEEDMKSEKTEKKVGWMGPQIGE